MLEFDLSATAVDGANQQTRTFGGMRGTCRQMGLEYFDKYEIMANANRIGEQAIELGPLIRAHANILLRRILKMVKHSTFKLECISF